MSDPDPKDARLDRPARGRARARRAKVAQPIAFAADVALRGYQLWLTTKARFSPTERQRLFGLTIAIGGVCGLVAVAFHQSIRWLETLTIERAFGAPGDAWIFWVIVVPSTGALVSGVMLYYVPGARGSGIPQVKVAYASKALKLRLRDSVGKFVIGALQIGTGSSLGREGPTVQICSGVAKGMGKIAGVSPQNLKLLLPVGAAAGIAAAFNAPIAAVTFTIEEIVGTLDQTLLSGVIVAAALAAVVERSVLGENPVFTIPSGYGLDHASSLLLYAALGVAAALASVAFTESLLRLRRRFNASTRLPAWLRPAIGGAVTGMLAVGAMLLIHVGGITGGGYEVLVQADGISIDRFKLDVGRHATFKPSEVAGQLLEVLENAGRQEVFPVLDVGQRLVGLITLEDLMALAAEPDLDRLVCATDIMRPPVALRRHDLVSRALELMMSIGVRQLPVVDDEQHVLGVLDEATIAHEYMRVRAGGRVDAATSGVRAIDSDATA